MNAEEMRAREHEVAQNEFADGEKGVDEDEVELIWFVVPGKTTVRHEF